MSAARLANDVGLARRFALFARSLGFADRSVAATVR